MRSLLPLVGLLILQPLFADKISLRNGESFEGDFFGATSQEIRFVVDGKLMNFATTAVTMIQFGEAPPAAPAAAPAPKPAPGLTSSPPPAKTAATPRPAPRATEPAEPAEPTAPRQPPTAASGRSGSDRPSIRRRGTGTATGEPSTGQAPVETASRRDDDTDDDDAFQLPDDFTIPRGTRLDVRLNETIDSVMNNSGQTFDAELVHPIVVRGKKIAPAGTSAVARMVESYEPGYGDSDRGSGRDPNEDRDQEYQVITIDLIALLIDGTRVPIRTNEVKRRIMSSKRDRAIEGLGRAGRELGTILGGSMGIPTGPTGQIPRDTTSPRGGSIPMGTILQFRIEDDFSGISAENFTE
jgi:hypothetical protein